MFTHSHTLSVTQGKGVQTSGRWALWLKAACWMVGHWGGDSTGSADPLHHACRRNKHPSLCERGGTKSVSLYNTVTETKSCRTDPSSVCVCVLECESDGQECEGTQLKTACSAVCSCCCLSLGTRSSGNRGPSEAALPSV